MNRREKEKKERINRVIDTLHNNKDATVITVGNQKGGVGKTTNTCLIGYRLAKMGLKTLVIDLDPQANATKMLVLTRDNEKEDITVLNKTIFAGIKDGSLDDLPINIMDNLYLIPANIDLRSYTKYVYRTYDNDYDIDHVLEPLIKPLKPEYDVILVDTPPFITEINTAAVTVSDFVLISLQTQQGSLDGANDFVNESLRPKAELYNLKVDVVGILPILFDENNRVDYTILEQAKQLFGEQNMFNTIIRNRARIKRFPVLGISDDSMYEHRIMQMFQDVSDELLDRLGIFLGVDDND